MNSEIFNVMDMNERDLEKLSKAELIKMVEKLQNKAGTPKIAIVEDNNGKLKNHKNLLDILDREIQKLDASLKFIQIDQNHQSNLPYQD